MQILSYYANAGAAGSLVLARKIFKREVAREDVFAVVYL